MGCVFKEVKMGIYEWTVITVVVVFLLVGLLVKIILEWVRDRNKPPSVWDSLQNKIDEDKR